MDMREIVTQFGGYGPMAQAIREVGGDVLWATAISNWVRRGRIPSKHQGYVLRAAKLRGVKLRPEDVIPGLEVA